MKIIEVTRANEISIAADLFREYQSFLNVDLCFQGFEEELATLPGKYASPEGAILLLQIDDVFVGCVAVRRLKAETCEMKRLYVKEGFRGNSAGRLLAESIIEQAKELGYKKMQLDTLQRLETAMSLYVQLGFKKIEPYYANPLSEVVYWELDLSE